MRNSSVGRRRLGSYKSHNAKEGRTAMPYLLNSLVWLHKDEGGQGLIEYVLILALIAFAAVASMKILATALSSAFSMVGNMLSSAVS